MNDLQTTNTEQEVQNLQEENELLLMQLHNVQEELEQYFQKFKVGSEQASHSTTDSKLVWVDEQLPDALAELERLRTLLEVQRRCHQVEECNSLNAQLGNILVDAADKPYNIVGVPSKLISIWRQSRRLTPPKELGGKEFGKVREVYETLGFDGVENLLESTPLSQAMRANALTALARQIMKRDAAAGAQAARLAYECDPRPYRLKWLAFRLHDAGQTQEAEAMIDLLPADTSFNDSEQRQVNQLRWDAKNVRQREARKQTAYGQKKAEVERKIRLLTRDSDESKHLLQQKEQQIEELKKASANLLFNGKQLEEKTEKIEQNLALELKIKNGLAEQLEEALSTKAKLEKDKKNLITERDQLRHEKKQTLHELGALEEQVRASRSEIEDIQRQFKQMVAEKNSAIEDRELLLSELRAEVLQITSQLNREKNRSIEIEETQDLLLAELHQVQEELQQYHLQKISLEEAVSSRENEIEIQKLENSRLEQRMNDDARDSAILLSKMKEQSEISAIEIVSLTEKIQQTKDLLDKTVSHNKKVQDNYESLSKDFLTTQQERDLLLAERVEFVQQIKDQHLAVTNLSQEVDGLNQLRIRMDQEYPLLIAARDEQAFLLERLESENARLVQERVLEKAEWVAARDEFEARLRHFVVEVATAEDRSMQLEEEKATLIMARGELSGTVQQLLQESEQLKQFNASLAGALEDVTASRDQHVIKADELAQEVEQLRNDTLLLQRNVIELESTGVEVRERIEQLLREAEQAGEEKAGLQRELADIKAKHLEKAKRVENLEKERVGFELEIQTQSDLKAEATRRLEQLAEELEQIKKGKSRLKRDLEALALAHQEAILRLEQSQSQLADSALGNERLEEELVRQHALSEEYSAKVHQQKLDLDQSQEEKAALAFELASLKLTNEEACVLIERHVAELDQLSGEKAVIESELASIVSVHGDLLKNHEQIKGENALLQQELINLTTLKDEVGIRGEQLAEELEQVKKNRSRLKRDIEALSVERDNLLLRLEQVEKKAEDLGQDKAALENELAGLIDTRTADVQELSGLKSAHQQQDATVQKLHQEIKLLQESKSSLEKDRSALKSVSEEQVAKAQSLAQELEQLKQSKSKLDKEKSNLIQQRESLDGKLLESSSLIAELQEQIKSSQLQEFESNNRLNLLKQELAAAEAQLQLIKEMFLSDRGNYDQS